VYQSTFPDIPILNVNWCSWVCCNANGMPTNLPIHNCKLIPFYARKTGHKLVMTSVDQDPSSFWVLKWRQTSLSLGPSLWGSKNRTGPDFKHYTISCCWYWPIIHLVIVRSHYHLDTEHTQLQKDERQSNHYPIAICTVQSNLRTKHESTKRRVQRFVDVYLQHTYSTMQSHWYYITVQ
jgi:hypothetical protein